MAWLLNLLSSCFGFAGFGEELYKDWDNHPAAQQYTFLKRLGEGGFSEVQLAKDNLTGKTVALKIVFLNKAGLKPEERRILGGEAKLLRMVAHPNIIRCSRILETQRQQVLVLEHLSGGEMLQQLQRVKRYTEAHACQLFRQIVDAVAYLHSLGIMHRDIKPENCLLAKPASHYKAKSKPVKVKLIDLGMAGLYRPRKPLYGCMGSPGFIAPEVVLGEAHTPAMDIYSLGVLLFVMLVGRKPWDAQRSHTLQYAVEATADAPGLQDPIFTALSPAAQQLVTLMLAEEPGDRPSAGDVLNHAWMLQGIKAPADGSPAIAPERLIQPAVQQRLNMLAHSRQIMGTARGIMLLHSRGSRSSAVAFHKAVKEARNKLQQQAAVLKAAGQIQGAAGTPFGAVDDTTGGETCGLQQRQLAPSSGAAATAASGTGRPASAAGNGATAVNRPGSGVTASLARPVSYSDPISAAAQSAAAGDLTAARGPLGLRRKSAIGDLARASLQQQSLLFTGPQRPPAVQAAAAAAAAAAAGHPPIARRASDEAPAAGTRVGVGAHYAAPDTAMVAQDLARGMSVPEPDLPFSVTNDYQAHRLDRAVTLSPGALALLDADDRMCLLAASQDDDESAAFFSWANRRGAADMIQSFKERYSVKQAALPLVRNLAKLGASLGRSLRHTVSSRGSHQGGMFSPRATRLGSEDTADGFTTPRPAATAAATTTDGFLSPRHSTARLLSASSGEDLTPDLELVSADDAAQQQQLRQSSDDGSSGGVTRNFRKTASVKFADEVPATSPKKQHEQPQQGLQQQADQQQAVTTPRDKPVAADLKAARRSNSATEALELAFLGTQLSISPTLSPLTSVTSATLGLRNSSDDGCKQALETANPRFETLRTAPETPRPIQPAGAAAAANKHFKEQHHGEQQGMQQGQGGFVTGAQQLPPIPCAMSLNPASSAASLTEGETAAEDVLLDENATSGKTGVICRQQQKQRKIVAKQPLKRLGQGDNSAAAPDAAAAAAAPKQQDAEAVAAAAALTPALASKRDLLKGGSNVAGNSSRKGAASAAPAAAGRVPLASPTLHSAAPAAAAVGYEEEGLNLPIGLWLQQSPNLSETGLLSPRVALAIGFTSGLGLELTAATSLSSAAESLRVLGTQDSMLNVAFAESQLSDYSSGDYTAPPQAAAATAEAAAAPETQQRSTRSSDADPWSQQQEQELLQEQQGTASNNQSAAESQHVQYSRRSAADRHKRDLSITDWLDPEQGSLAWPVADGDSESSGFEWLGHQQEKEAAAAEAHKASVSSSMQRKPISPSRQVAVPHSMASSSRHSQGKSHRHRSDHRLGHSGPQRGNSSEDSPELLATPYAAGPGTAVAGDVGILRSSAMEQNLGQSIGTEGQELGFCVGSYSNAEGLAGQRDSESGLDETVGSLGLNSNDIECSIVDRLGHAAEQGWEYGSLPAPGLSKVVAATVPKALQHSLAANAAAAAAAVSNGRSKTGSVHDSGQDEFDIALQMGPDGTEVNALEPPLINPTASRSNPAAGTGAAGNAGNSVKTAATASGMQLSSKLPPGRLTAAVGATRTLGKQGSGGLKSGSNTGSSGLPWPASGTSKSSSANGALLVESNQSKTPQLHENVRNSSPPRLIPIVKGNKRVSGRRIGVHPVYDGFDEPTAL